MRKLRDIFVYSGFRVFPHEITQLPEGERNMIFAFFEDAIENKELPIVLGNFKTEKR